MLSVVVCCFLLLAVYRYEKDFLMRALFVVLLLAAVPVQAGALADFEQSAKSPKSSGSSNSGSSSTSSGGRSDADASGLMGGLLEGIIELFFRVLAEGGANSAAKAESAFAPDDAAAGNPQWPSDTSSPESVTTAEIRTDAAAENDAENDAKNGAENSERSDNPDDPTKSPGYSAPSASEADVSNAQGQGFVQGSGLTGSLASSPDGYSVSPASDGALDTPYESGYTRKKPGDHLLPFMQADFSVGDGTYGTHWNDLRLEAGYGPVALLLRQGNYSEENSSDRLTTQQVMLTYRMMFFDRIELNFGGGHYSMDGQSVTSSGAMYYGGRLLLNESFSVGFRNTSVNGLNLQLDDTEWLMQIGSGNWSGKLSYRSLETDSMRIAGPSVGLVFTF
ncbi:hypothetical protein ACQUQU_14000 [Thalassolituus sp. LLYu03]|uniref:hypothetical protein n=1 Tax=Thalassolituus sp. LLYu03 TaxID=3421656 RepID=UPI003D2AEF50